MNAKIGLSFRVRALLFDMDGTLVNSTAVVERTWTRFAERHRLDVDRVLAACHGRRTSETVAEFAPPGISVAEETARVDAEDLADIDGILEVDGAVRLLASLPADRWTLVTSADRDLAARRMAAAGLRMSVRRRSGGWVEKRIEGFRRSNDPFGSTPAHLTALRSRNAPQPARCAATQPRIIGPLIAPLCRATSRPPRNSARVGIARMPWRAAS